MNSLPRIPYATLLAIAAAIAGLLLPFQTIWILRPGMLGGVPWSLATIGVYASDFVLLIAAVIGFRRHWRTDRRRLVVAFAVLAAAALLNVGVSADPWMSAIGWLRLIALLLALAGLPSWSTSMRRAFLGGFLVAMLGQAILAFLQFAAQEVWASTLLGVSHHAPWVFGDAVVATASGRWLRAYGGFPHPNVLGAALLVAMIAVSAIWHGGRGTTGRQGAMGWGSSVMFVIALVFSFSRAALLGLLVLLAVWALRPSTRRLAAVSAVALVAAIAVTWSLWSPRITASNRIEVRSLSERRSAFVDARGLLADHRATLIGVGLHGMPATVLRSIDSSRNPYTVQPVHNVPFLALTEIGVLGILVLLLVLWQLARSACVIRHALLIIPLLPSFLLDHALWSLAVGPALLLALAVAIARVRNPSPTT